MIDEELKKVVMQSAVRVGDRLKLSCERGHQLATEFGVTVQQVGAICLLNNIKIVHCQLGCFGDHHG